MSFPRTILFSLAIVSAATMAAQPTLTPNGYTGLAVTPSAHLLAWGRAEAGYDNQLPGVLTQPRGHNYVLGFGLFPNMEIVGRLATNDLRSSCFVSCGARDLSASAKFGIGLDQGNRFRMAAGATDLGGAATNFRTYYGVLTFNDGPFEVSAGVARRTGAGFAGSRSPLHGPFAAVAWQPHPSIRGHVEYADGNGWAGVRVFAPAQWLPEDWTLSVGANARLNQSPLTEKTWWTASVSIPLYRVPALPGAARSAALPKLDDGLRPLPAYEARVPASQDLQGAQPLAPAPAPTPSAGTERPPDIGQQLRALADALEQRGLEDIWVGELPDRSIAVRVNNGAFQWNAADAIGAALGALAQSLGREQIPYRLVVTQRQVPLVAVTGRTDCLWQWIAGEKAACAAGQLTTAGAHAIEPMHQDVNWHVQGQRAAWKILRVGISPALRTTVGTEVGAFDFSAGATIRAQLPLWAGASVEWFHTVPLAESTNFEPQGLFADRRLRSGVERVSITQTVRVPLERWFAADAVRAAQLGLSAVTAQATVGRVGRYFDGALGSVRWEPGTGVHRWSAQAGGFQNNEFNGGFGPLRNLKTAYPVLGSYRYHVSATRTFLEATAGQFMYNDRGFQLGVRQWFSDVSVGLAYKRTRFGSGAVTQIAQIELTLPIGPRRDVSLFPVVQLGSEPRFSYGIGTVIRNAAGNPLRPGVATLPPVPTVDATFNSDRSGLIYFEDNARRIRDAAR